MKMMTKGLKKKHSQPPAALPPMEPPARGPAGLKKASEALLSDEDMQIVSDEPPDVSILNHVMGRLHKRGPFAQPELALEILDGPYKGIVFSFTKFTMMPAKLDNGMVPTVYETEVHVIPTALKDTFVKDEAFDNFTTEILMSWMSYLHTNDLSPLVKMRSRAGVQ